MTTLSSIGPTTAVRGNVQGDGDLEILGRVEGSIAMTGDVTVGESALIQSDVRGRRVVVRGAVLGNVTGDDAVILEPGARVVGDLGAPQIGIRPGALVRGNVTTGSAARPQAQAAARAAAPAVAAPRAAPARPAQRAPAPPPAPRPAARAAAPAARPAPAPRPAEPKLAPPPPPPEPRHVPAPDEAVKAGSNASPGSGDSEEEPEAAASDGRPPPPVVPALRKGAATKAALRKKGGR
jgi:cytoskeletal protein CcmA (bactofilin family)